MDKFNINNEIDKIVNKSMEQLKEKLYKASQKDRQYTVKKTMLSLKDTTPKQVPKKDTRKSKKRYTDTSDSDSD
jgi:hypothetical protein